MRSIFLPLSASLLLSLPLAGRAQDPAAPEPPPVAIDDFKAEPVNAPGGAKPWLRLLAAFSSRPDWADGIAIYYDILVRKGEDYRVLNGTARYSNVKRGRHSAVLYMSPSAVERFGAPVAALIGIGYNDELFETFKWTAPNSSAPEGWSTSFERYANQLQPIYLTPFVATEYGRFPDAIAAQ